jgi:hypothetical protein
LITGGASWAEFAKCVEVRAPFYEGENMLVIHPDECIEICAMPALSQKQTFSDVRFLSNDVRSASES